MESVACPFCVIGGWSQRKVVSQITDVIRALMASTSMLTWTCNQTDNQFSLHSRDIICALWETHKTVHGAAFDTVKISRHSSRAAHSNSLTGNSLWHEWPLSGVMDPGTDAMGAQYEVVQKPS